MTDHRHQLRVDEIYPDGEPCVRCSDCPVTWKFALPVPITDLTRTQYRHQLEAAEQEVDEKSAPVDETSSSDQELITMLVDSLKPSMDLITKQVDRLQAELDGLQEDLYDQGIKLDSLGRTVENHRKWLLQLDLADKQSHTQARSWVDDLDQRVQLLTQRLDDANVRRPLEQVQAGRVHAARYTTTAATDAFEKSLRGSVVAGGLAASVDMSATTKEEPSTPTSSER